MAIVMLLKPAPAQVQPVLLTESNQLHMYAGQLSQEAAMLLKNAMEQIITVQLMFSSQAELTAEHAKSVMEKALAM